MKKYACVLFVIVFCATALFGCSEGQNADLFRRENEIVTYQRIDPEKTQIIVSRTGNIPVEQLCSAFSVKNPDVQVVYIDITGGDSGYQPLIDWIENEAFPDIVISTANFFDSTMTLKHFENLSADPIVKNYQAAALKRTSIDGEIYWLPGPSDISAMIYNKTLFSQYGWKVPKTFDEFVQLCDQIREDTNGEIEPWNPNAKYSNELQTAIEAFTYEEIFGGVDNRTWYNNFIAGNEKFTGHMEPYTDVLQTLYDHDIIREEHFSYSATTRGKEFLAGKIAMINAKIYNADNDEFNFGYMPFPTTVGELGYLCDSYSCYIGLPKKEHTKQQENAIRRFIEFFSSAEGQLAYIGDTMKVSNVIGVQLNQENDLAALQPAIDAGHMFALLEFGSEDGKVSNVYLHGIAEKMMSGEETAAHCFARIDREPYSPADEAPKVKPEAIATAPQDMSVLETSFYIADAYREAAQADIGLIANNIAYRGNLMRIFAGDITAAVVNVLKPRSFANDSTLVKASMTGRQIVDALNDPMDDNVESSCIYAYSGLKCEVAPWNVKGEKYVSIKLADSTPLDMEKLYTVSFWAGTVKDAYITEILNTYEQSFNDILLLKLANDGEMKAADDNRIKLIWD